MSVATHPLYIRKEESSNDWSTSQHRPVPPVAVRSATAALAVGIPGKPVNSVAARAAEFERREGKR